MLDRDTKRHTKATGGKHTLEGWSEVPYMGTLSA